MEEVLGHPLAYQIGPRRAGDVAAIWAESNSSLPGWEPKLGLVEALRDAWRWQQRISGKSTHTDAAQ
jgi:UDP-glucose 4-epimerase